jgi:hypothetical protein
MLHLFFHSLKSIGIRSGEAMASRIPRELGLIGAWFLFPLVPVVLADFYYLASNWTGDDPREWGWSMWVVRLGPLLGYGFLAGATVDLPDDVEPTARGWRGLAARRSVWVAIGPWWGALVLSALWLGYGYFIGQFTALQTLSIQEPNWVKGTWPESVLAWIVAVQGWVLIALVLVTWAYGWLWPAWAALRRAARIGTVSRAFYRGLSVALAFVGSLFGSFWAVTSFWRSYFFDSRLVPLILAAACLAMTSGCATLTYGEVRRRELFHAMLVAWVLGLALMWRWWSRSRPGPPQGGASQ